MAATYINKVDNASVYIDGNSFLGRAKSVKCPEFEIEMSEHKNLGLVGTLKLPSGVTVQEGEIVWDGYYPEVAAIASNPFQNRQIMIRANTAVYNAAGRLTEVPLVIIMNCTFKKSPLGEYKPQENAEYTTEFSVTSITQKIDGKEVLHFDAYTNAFRVAGDDVLTKYRSNIGS